MKTPLQKLIKQLKESEQFITEQFITDEDSTLDRYYRGGLREAIKKAETMLEKEKEVIMNAFLDGYTHSPDDGFPEYARNYYNETFKTKEK